MIFAVKPFEIHDGDGIRTTVFFKGCSLRCRWCHNPESFESKAELAVEAALCTACGSCAAVCAAHTVCAGEHRFDRAQCTACGRCAAVCPRQALTLYGEERDADDLAEELLKDEIFFKGSGGGVTFSGGEPLLQIDLCVALAQRLKARGVTLAIDTCGEVPRRHLERIAPFADQFLWDIKAVDEAVHIVCTGVSNRRILENLRFADSLSIPIEIRYPYVPTMNDGEWEAVAQFVNGLHNVTALRVLPYHNYAAVKYAALGRDAPLSDVPIPTAEEIRHVVEGMQKLGVQHACTF